MTAFSAATLLQIRAVTCRHCSASFPLDKRTTRLIERTLKDMNAYVDKRNDDDDTQADPTEQPIDIPDTLISPAAHSPSTPDSHSPHSTSHPDVLTEHTDAASDNTETPVAALEGMTAKSEAIEKPEEPATTEAQTPLQAARQTTAANSTTDHTNDQTDSSIDSNSINATAAAAINAKAHRNANSRRSPSKRNRRSKRKNRRPSVANG